MHERWEAQLPLYVAGTLAPDEAGEIERHLRDCAACAAAADDWRQLAAVVRADAAERVHGLPPLSPVVRAALPRRLPLGEAVAAARGLVWAQRSLLKPLLPGILVVLLLGVAASLALTDAARAGLPLVALAPLVAALPIAFLHSRELDPAFDVVGATPTAPGVLLLSRLTFVLALVSSVMLPGSLLVSVLRGSAFGSLVASWLGPLLLLSALATLLSLRFSALVTVGVVMAGWLGVLGALWAELGGHAALPFPLAGLLQPGGGLLAAQLLVAAALWALAWRALPRWAAAEPLS